MSATPSTPKVDNTLGALLLGGLFAMALWGVTCSQTYSYFMYPFRDPRHMKLMVVLLWLLDTLDSALNAHILYCYMVRNFWNQFAMYKPTWSVNIHVAMTTITNFIIRTMFMEKVYFLSDRNICLTAGLMAISITDLVVGLVVTVKAFGITSFLDIDDLSNLFYLMFALGIAGDLSLAVTLCLLFRRNRTGFQGTDSMISSLVLYAVNTGVIVVINASLGMIMYILMPNNLIFLAFYLLQSKLYLNAYLATLNGRVKLRSGKGGRVSIHLSQISNCQYAVESSSPTFEKESNGMSQVDIHEKPASIYIRQPHDNLVLSKSIHNPDTKGPLIAYYYEVMKWIDPGGRMLLVEPIRSWRLIA
ncbi:hypothetical protein BYT27DRAFT_6455435 [Phlegmacium glaucopus]|nr:hypothetical protein BYT27DRAFT_6455435 [Phlegmacium glaucopus]